MSRLLESRQLAFQGRKRCVLSSLEVGVLTGDRFDVLYVCQLLQGRNNNINNNNSQFNKTTLQFIYTLNYMAKFRKYLK